MYSKYFPKWLLLEIMFIIEKWKNELNMFIITDALKRDTKLLDEYYRILNGTQFEHKEKLRKEEEEMKRQFEENDGIIVIPGLSKLLDSDDKKTYKISSDNVKIVDKSEE